MRYRVTAPGGVALGRPSANEVELSQRIVGHLRFERVALFVRREGSHAVLEVNRSQEGDIEFTYWDGADTEPWAAQLVGLVGKFWRS